MKPPPVRMTTIPDVSFADWEKPLVQLYARVQRWTPPAFPPASWPELMTAISSELRLSGGPQIISPTFFPELRRLTLTKGVWGSIILGEILKAWAYADSTRQKVRQVEARFRAFRASLPAPCDSAPLQHQVVWFAAEEASRPLVNTSTTVESHIKDLGKAGLTRGVHNRQEVKELLRGLERSFVGYEPQRGPAVTPQSAVRLFEKVGPLARFIGLIWVENALRPSDVRYLLLLPVSISEQKLRSRSLFQIRLAKRKNAQRPLPFPPMIQVSVPSAWATTARERFHELTTVPLERRREVLSETLGCLVNHHGYAVRNGVVLTLGTMSGVSHQEVGYLLGHSKSLDPTVAHRYLEGPSQVQKEQLMQTQQKFSPSDRFHRLLGRRRASQI